MDIASKFSIHSLPPLERGGVEARNGFAFQDHVAARNLIRLLEEPTLLEVWCETHDDITLIWQGQPSQEVEYVQVKSHTLDRFWSLAMLSRRDRDNGKVQHGSSIFERSLANDRCSEPSHFRLVTCIPPNSDLSVLQLPHNAPDRTIKADALKKLADDLDGRTNNFRSPNGNGAHYWFRRMRWEVQQSGDSLCNDSKMKLSRLLATKGIIFFPDQLDNLYSHILAQARDAATSDWGTCPSAKKICKEAMTSWLNSHLESISSQPTTAGTRLKDKLSRAGLAEGDILASMMSRQKYLSERYQPKYLKLSDLTHLGDEVSAVLQGLRAKLDSGEMSDNGIVFHSECLKAVEQLRQHHSDPKPPLSVLQGCMYDIADRCVHRFRKESA